MVPCGRRRTSEPRALGQEEGRCAWSQGQGGPGQGLRRGSGWTQRLVGGWETFPPPRPTAPQAPALTGQHLSRLPSQQLGCRVDNSKAEESGNRAHSSFPAHYRLLTMLIATARHR